MCGVDIYVSEKNVSISTLPPRQLKEKEPKKKRSNREWGGRQAGFGLIFSFTAPVNATSIVRLDF